MVSLCTLTFQICATVTMSTESDILTTAQDHSLYNRAEFLPIFLNGVSPSLSQLNCIHSTKAATAALWYSLSAWKPQTSYTFLKLVNAASTNTPLPLRVSVLLAKSMQGRQYPLFSCLLYINQLYFIRYRCRKLRLPSRGNL